MKNCFECLKSKKVIWFVTGAASMILGKCFLKSDVTRKTCIKTMAKAIKLQNDAQEAFQNMKEDAEDLCFDAKEEATEETRECSAKA